MVGGLAVLVLLAFAAGCGLVSDQAKQEAKQEAKQKVDAQGQQARQEAKKKADELLKKVDAQRQQN